MRQYKGYFVPCISEIRREKARTRKKQRQNQQNWFRLYFDYSSGKFILCEYVDYYSYLSGKHLVEISQNEYCTEETAYYERSAIQKCIDELWGGVIKNEK